MGFNGAHELENPSSVLGNCGSTSGSATVAEQTVVMALSSEGTAACASSACNYSMASSAI
jgi:hypothetical protein